MVWVLVGVVAVVCAVIAMKGNGDATLIAKYNTTYARARSLPEYQLGSLTRQMQEFMAIERRMVSEGVSPKTARRMSMKACIGSMEQALELNRRMPG